MTSTLIHSMIAVFHKDQLICVTEENSEVHQEYIAANKEAIQEQIEKWREPFNDQELLFFNLGKVCAEQSARDLLTYVTCVAGPGIYREAYLEGGLDAVRKAMRYQCLLDYYRLRAGSDLFRKSEHADKGREEFVKFMEALTDEDVYRHIYCDKQKYEFRAVPVR